MPDSPIDIPTAATIAFIAAQVPAGKTILEVGCGAGHVAAGLSRQGYAVTGVECDPDALARARGRNVAVVDAKWPEVSVAAVDAVVFSRSLHHISPLPAAVAGIGAVLQPDGIVLVEDFAFDAVSPAAVRWLLHVTRRAMDRGLIADDPDAFLHKLNAAHDPLLAWHREHDHDLHSFDDITREIGRLLVIRETRYVPYLYRYLVPVLRDTARATAFIAEVQDEETRLGEKGEISLIGRRLVAAMA